MNWLVNLVGGGLAETVRKGVGMITGDKAAREAGYHEESMASHNQFAAEFQVQNRTRLDSLIDALNRLPRPVIVAMVIYYFVVAVIDPQEFQIINLALDTVPESMWKIALVIVAFYFVAREFHYARNKKMALSKGDFDEHMRRVKELRAAQEDPVEEEGYQSAMADTSKPLSNSVIEEWNRRQAK